jgi:hypothetical protein
MSSPLSSTTVWLEVTLGGFLYLVSAFLLFQSWFGIHDLQCFSSGILPYLATVVIAASYVFGLMLHSLIPTFFRWILPDDVKQYLRSNIPDQPLKDPSTDNVLLALKGTPELHLQLKGIYSGAVLFRILTPGILLFGFALASWFMDTPNEHYSPFVLLVAFVFFILTLCMYREYFARYKRFEMSALKALSPRKARSKRS